MKFAARTCRPRDHLVTAGQLYPGAWRAADQLRARRGEPGAPTWPDWCYLPIAGTYAIVATDAGINDRLLAARYPERIPDASRLAALAAWRMTQGIYRFDPAVYDAVRATPVAGDIPHDVLYRLPEWCIYIETPGGINAARHAVAGSFVHLEHDANTGAVELRLVLDIDIDGGTMLVPLPLHLGAWPLAESIHRALEVARSTATARGRAADLEQLEQQDWISATVEPIVSLTLYVCSQAAEIGDERRRPTMPQPVRTRRDGWRLFPADRVTTWDVGVRLGAALRRAYQAEQTGAAGRGEHAGPRPHIRRAHWHGYWSGPRDGERRYDLRWMPPIAVNVDDAGALPAVVRPVR